MAGVFERVIENIFPLIWNALDFISILKTNDICYSDEQLIQEYATMWGDICKNAVIVHGMEPLTWNKDLKLSHIKQSDFKKEKKAFKKAH